MAVAKVTEIISSSTRELRGRGREGNRAGRRRRSTCAEPGSPAEGRGRQGQDHRVARDDARHVRAAGLVAGNRCSRTPVPRPERLRSWPRDRAGRRARAAGPAGRARGSARRRARSTRAGAREPSEAVVMASTGASPAAASARPPARARCTSLVRDVEEAARARRDERDEGGRQVGGEGGREDLVLHDAQRLAGARAARGCAPRTSRPWPRLPPRRGHRSCARPGRAAPTQHDQLARELATAVAPSGRGASSSP